MDEGVSVKLPLVARVSGRDEDLFLANLEVLSPDTAVLPEVDSSNAPDLPPVVP